MPFAKEFIITNNRISNTDGRAIELRGQFGPIEGVIIKGNTCIKTLGIHVQSSSNVLLHDNIIDQNEVVDGQVFGIHLVSCNSVTTLGNPLLGVRTHGINASNSDNLNLSSNIFTGGTSNGVIRVSNGQKLIMTNNQFQVLNVLSVFTSGGDNIIFVNNIITSNRSDNTNFQGATTINLFTRARSNLMWLKKVFKIGIQ